MHLCYLDESGTPDIPGNTSHYILAGLSVPDTHWKQHHGQLERIKQRYGLEEAEIHVAWMMRSYLEQKSIPGFETRSYDERKAAVRQRRTAELLRLQKVSNKTYK